MLRASKKDALSNAKIFFKKIAEWSGEEVKFQKSGIFLLNASYQNWGGKLKSFYILKA